MATELTDRQREVFDFICEAIREESRPPTVREISEHFGFRSPKAASDHLSALERKDYIVRKNSSARNIKVRREFSPLGMPLVEDTSEAAQDATVFRACETCGWEGEIDQRTCPEDGSELLVVDPSDSTSVAPTIPLLICPRCREYAPPGTAHCPEDGEVLTPLSNIRMTELPRNGIGPRRKICRECGERFSGAADYCPRDGVKLVALN